MVAHRTNIVAITIRGQTISPSLSGNASLPDLRPSPIHSSISSVVAEIRTGWQPMPSISSILLFPSSTLQRPMYPAARDHCTRAFSARYELLGERYAPTNRAEFVDSPRRGGVGGGRWLRLSGGLWTHPRIYPNLGRLTRKYRCLGGIPSAVKLLTVKVRCRLTRKRSWSESNREAEHMLVPNDLAFEQV